VELVNRLTAVLPTLTSKTFTNTVDSIMTDIIKSRPDMSDQEFHLLK
jgi:hypothetical protein